MANLTLRYLDELSYVLNSRRHLATQAKASSVGDLLNADEDRFHTVSFSMCTWCLYMLFGISEQQRHKCTVKIIDNYNL